MRRLLLIFALLLALPSCSDSTKTPETSSSPPSAPPTAEDQEKVKLFASDLACQQFFVELNTAMLYHLTVPTNDSARGRLLAEGYRAALQSLGKNDAVEELLSAAGDSISDCKPFHAAAAKLKEFFPDRDPLILLYQVVLDATLRKMDPFSHFDTDDSGYYESNWGVGIQFRYRTDYLLGRKPKYLVVEQFSDRSLNRDLLGEGARIREIQVSGGTGGSPSFRPVSDFEFGEIVDGLNQASPAMDRIVVKAEKRKSPTEFESPAEVTLQFDRHVPHLARFRFLGDDRRVGVIRLLSFRASTSAQDVKREWSILLRTMDAATLPEGLILDLRGNGGGLLSQAKVLLETLLPIRSPCGQMIRIAVPGEGPDNSRLGSKPSLVLPPPETDEDREAIDVESLIVLVDRGTASASEIVAAALRDFERAAIVGETTFGKGIGQRPFPVGAPLDGTAWVTSMLFFSPKGESHQGRGIVPDIEIEDLLNSAQAKVSGKPTRMKEFQKQVVNESLIQKALQDLDLSQIEPVPDEHRFQKAEIDRLREAARAMHPPASCDVRSAEDPKFREEDDCLLDWAELLMRQRLEWKKTGPGSV